MKRDPLAGMRWDLLNERRQFGSKRARSRALYFIHSLVISGGNEDYIARYKQACREILGGTW